MPQQTAASRNTYILYLRWRRLKSTTRVPGILRHDQQEQSQQSQQSQTVIRHDRPRGRPLLPGSDHTSSSKIRQ